jgi:hypothetical protein
MTSDTAIWLWAAENKIPTAYKMLTIRIIEGIPLKGKGKVTPSAGIFYCSSLLGKWG